MSKVRSFMGLAWHQHRNLFPGSLVMTETAGGDRRGSGAASPSDRRGCTDMRRCIYYWH